MQRVEEPGEKANRIALLGDRELFLRAQYDRLQHLMRWDVRLKVSWIPKFSQQFAESLCEYRVQRVFVHQPIVVAFVEKVVPQMRHMRQRLQNDITIVVRLYVVHANNTGQIGGTVECPAQLWIRVQRSDLVFGERWLEHIGYIAYGRRTRISQRTLCRTSAQRGTTYLMMNRWSHNCRADSRTSTFPDWETHDDRRTHYAYRHVSLYLYLENTCRIPNMHRRWSWTVKLSTVSRNRNPTDYDWSCPDRDTF